MLGHASPYTPRPARASVAGPHRTLGRVETTCAEAWLAVLTPLQSSGAVFGIPTGWLLVGGIMAIGVGVGVRVWQEYRNEPFMPSLDRLSATDPQSSERTSTEPAESFAFDASRADPPVSGPVEDGLQDARRQYSDGEYRDAIEAAYVAALNRISQEPGDASTGTKPAASPRGKAADDGRTRTRFEELSELYERAVFEPGYEATAADASRSIEHAETLIERRGQAEG